MKPWSEPFIPPGYISLGMATLVAVVAALALGPDGDAERVSRVQPVDTIEKMLLRNGVHVYEDETDFFLVPPMAYILEQYSRKGVQRPFVCSMAEHILDSFRKRLAAGKIMSYIFNGDDGPRDVLDERGRKVATMSAPIWRPPIVGTKPQVAVGARQPTPQALWDGGPGMTITVLRDGATAHHWSGQGRDFQLRCDGQLWVAMDFSMPSKGGGTTDVSVRIDAASFKDLCEAMMRVGPNEAVKASERPCRRASIRPLCHIQTENYRDRTPV